MTLSTIIPHQRFQTMFIILIICLMSIESESFKFHDIKKSKDYVNNSIKLRCNLNDIFKFFNSNARLDRIEQVLEILINNTKETQNELNQLIINTQETEKQVKETNKQLKDTDKQVKDTDKRLKELIGYNQNQDSNLEGIIGKSLMKYMIEILNIDKQYIKEFKEKKLYNCENGNVAVEWDSIFLVDYSGIINENDPLMDELPLELHNTIFLLEVKQNMRFDEVIEKIPKRLSKTRDTINYNVLSAKRDIQVLTALQRSFFLKNPKFVVALGSKNLDDITAETVVCSNGFLAISPSGDDFQVKNDKTNFKIF